MGGSRTVLFYEKCRLCLENPGAEKIIDVEGLAADIFVYTKVKVTSKDNLPQKICDLCRETIQKIKELRETASKNDLALKSLLFEDTGGDTNTLENTDEENPLESTKDPLSDTQTEWDRKRKSVDHREIKKHKKSKKPSPEPSSSNKAGKSFGLRVRTDLMSTPASDVSSSTKAKKRSRQESDDSVTCEFECGECKKRFETHKKLYLHMRQHNKNMICPLDACGKKFASKNDLERHLRTHTGVRPYVCDICDKSFTQSGTLTIHKERVHCVFVWK